MEEQNKLPLKRVELSLTKFNEVAIPHHLDLLRQHKANIIKYEENGEYPRVRSEQVHARRVASQLRVLLAELETLRRQVRPEDLTKFDKLTQRSRDLTLRAIMDYLGIIESSCRAIVARGASPRRSDTSPLSINRRPPEQTVAGSTMSTDSVGIISRGDDVQELESPLIQLQVNEQEVALREREAVLRGWSELQSEVRALHEAWQTVQAAALADRERVATVSTNVEVAAENVEVARTHLSAAERLKAGAMGAGGAVLGAALCGPAGLVLGAKAGAAAALAGSLLGYLGARLVGNRRRAVLDHAGDKELRVDKDEKKSQ
ncbi:syntaxin-17 isoform X1 [Manduca sexta]|uniref:syntaxin-17 isoform X1 n=1 Tax=Manduca sexta TaxID=7130 RepID=UPI00188F7F55|nr:syntaxin-17 isoform X1 [Manduca sexta]